MTALGSHIIAELSFCAPEMLSDLAKVREAMVRAAFEAGAEVREVAFHRFHPHGVSGVVVISESHLSVHTWPEYRYAAIDIYTCGSAIDPWKACAFLASVFGSRRITTTEVRRGICMSPGSYSHVVTSVCREGEAVVPSAS